MYAQTLSLHRVDVKRLPVLLHYQCTQAQISIRAIALGNLRKTLVSKHCGSPGHWRSRAKGWLGEPRVGARLVAQARARPRARARGPMRAAWALLGALLGAAAWYEGLDNRWNAIGPSTFSYTSAARGKAERGAF